MNGETWQIILIGIIALLLLLPALKFLLTPVRLIFKILVNGLMGFLILWLINIFAEPWGFFLPINTVTVLVAGFLGIPGIILLSLLKFFLIY
ncbi:pro-sigmaK processing inhibitor BofA family protein [Dehalobacterium formicoaceticum]|uniref:Pro-sigmaK processing inhibitor BofA family protein n=1 Tax=Dehalobacterium formicoaceticum TaxID=51515 RepID=A0ABT1Y831_9FIRM|nr:pro-sigmaK processing inhibitor BofA family protein [Dehalobacterium formicoaceticum]MCR6547042.1 pro-sigmaK processing inhibitor BofA family protein [Dehalobacterium formicoaceticum]